MNIGVIYDKLLVKAHSINAKYTMFEKSPGESIYF